MMVALQFNSWLKFERIYMCKFHFVGGWKVGGWVGGWVGGEGQDRGEGGRGQGKTTRSNMFLSFQLCVFILSQWTCSQWGCQYAGCQLAGTPAFCIACHGTYHDSCVKWAPNKQELLPMDYYGVLRITMDSYGFLWSPMKHWEQQQSSMISSILAWGFCVCPSLRCFYGRVTLAVLIDPFFSHGYANICISFAIVPQWRKLTSTESLLTTKVAWLAFFSPKLLLATAHLCTRLIETNPVLSCWSEWQKQHMQILVTYGFLQCIKMAQQNTEAT